MTDFNAAGSTFAMAACLAAALAMNTRWTRAWRRPGLVRAAWTLLAALLVLAVWLSGSRMAILAVIGGLGVTLLWARLRATPRWPWRAAAVAPVALIAALGLALDPRPSASRSAAKMMTMRGDFMVTGLRMMASAPVFGVGIGRYFETSGRFMPSSIYWFYFHENAHNNFLQIGGELGLVGLAAFCLAAGVSRDPSGARPPRRSRRPAAGGRACGPRRVRRDLDDEPSAARRGSGVPVLDAARRGAGAR